MQIRYPQIEVPETDPFAHDTLDRESAATTLSTLVAAINGPSVLSVDGDFGSGKTTFLRMWQKSLEQQGQRCLFLDAWKTDFVDDPLVALLGELHSAADSYGVGGELLSKLKKAAGGIAKKAIPVAIRLATMGLLAGDELDAVLPEAFEELTKERLRSYEESKKNIEGFRKALSELVEEWCPDGDKLIVIVDELDRCRPNYAIETLERIKHLFDVPGVIFVLGIDTCQLRETVRAVYGRDMDADGYLRRFIDFDFHLPPPKPAKFGKALFSSLASGETQADEAEELLCHLMDAASFPLRQQEQTIVRYLVSMAALRQTEFASEVAMCVFLREWNRETYQEFQTMNLERPSVGRYGEFTDRLGNSLPRLVQNTGAWTLFQGLIYAAGYDRALKEGKPSAFASALSERLGEGHQAHRTAAIARQRERTNPGFQPYQSVVACIELSQLVSRFGRRGSDR